MVFLRFDKNANEMQIIEHLDGTKEKQQSVVFSVNYWYFLLSHRNLQRNMNNGESFLQ